ncbi:MAG: PEGA domain-containing protein [Candidatus Competibacteraceae bacterium]|nr:PEGA domain-containing protein [Candidatus Competibacteraceae bacterium]
MWKRGMWGTGLAAAMLVACMAAGCGAAKPEAAKATITITSAPEEGASLLVAGEDKGVTPVTLAGVKPGWLDLILQKDGFKRTVDRVEVKPGDSRHFVIDMTPVVGFVTIESEPFGAEVYLNGVVIGKTPILKHPVSIGGHDYELRLANHYPVQGAVEVVEDFQYEFRHTLKPMEATVSILSRPSSASIYINNELRPEKTPVKLRLDPGLFIIGVRAKRLHRGRGAGYAHRQRRARHQPHHGPRRSPRGHGPHPRRPLHHGCQRQRPRRKPPARGRPQCLLYR